MTGRDGKTAPFTLQGLSGTASLISSYAACRVTHNQRRGQQE